MNPEVEWPLREISSAYRLKINDVQSLGKIVVLDTNQGRLALKKSTLQPEELDLEYNICEHLLTTEFKHVAKIVTAYTGKGYAKINNQYFILTHWLEGNHANFQIPDQLDLSTRTLARFHLAAQHYSGKVYWQKRRLYGVWPQRFAYRQGYIHWYRKCLVNRGIKDEFDQLFMENVDKLSAQALGSIQRLRKNSYYELSAQARDLGTICHHDYAHHNLLISDAAVQMIDFDYCILDTPLHDLGSLILRVVKLSNWCLEDAQRILVMYHEEKPILPAELDVLLGFLEFPQDFWQLAWAKYNEVGMHRSEILLARLHKFLDLRPAREQFLTEFSDRTSKKIWPWRDTL